MFLLGILFSFAHSEFNGRKSKAAFYSAILGFLAGISVFALRMYDPRGMNLLLLAFNRKLIIFVAGTAVITAFFILITLFFNNKFLRIIDLLLSSVLIFASLIPDRLKIPLSFPKLYPPKTRTSLQSVSVTAKPMSLGRIVRRYHPGRKIALQSLNTLPFFSASAMQASTNLAA